MVIHRIFHIIRLNEVRRAKICAHLIRNQLPIISGNLRLIVCHAKPPVDSTFPSEQILSKKETNGQTGIQKPCEIRFRDQKVAGSNPVTSTKKDCQRKLTVFCYTRGMQLWRFETAQSFISFGPKQAAESRLAGIHK